MLNQQSWRRAEKAKGAKAPGQPAVASVVGQALFSFFSPPLDDASNYWFPHDSSIA
jgi:hypothetical protein